MLKGSVGKFATDAKGPVMSLRRIVVIDDKGLPVWMTYHKTSVCDMLESRFLEPKYTVMSLHPRNTPHALTGGIYF